MQIPKEHPAAADFKGVKVGADGRIIPTAYNKIQTFENGKNPLEEIYVGTQGSDNGNGTQSSPYATFAKALSEAVPGTSVKILPGTYEEFASLLNLRATENNPIWFGGVPGMERPVIKLKIPENGRGTEGIHVTKCSYVIIHDIEVNGSCGHGLNTDDGGEFDNFEATHHIVYRNLYVHNINDSPFKFAGANYTYIFDCEVENGHVTRSSGTIDHVGCHNNTIAYNYIHDPADQDGQGVLFKGGSFGAKVYNNLFVNAGLAVTLGQHSGDNLFRPTLIKDNTMYEASDAIVYSNIFIGGKTSVVFGSSTKCYFVNNTVIKPSNFLFRVVRNSSNWEVLSNLGGAHDNIISNNIFCYGVEAIAEALNLGMFTEVKDYRTFVMQNNLFFNTDNQKDNKPNDLDLFLHEATVFQDPLFADMSKNNFALQSESPAVKGGVNASFDFATEDFYGKKFADSRSIGAVQF